MKNIFLIVLVIGFWSTLSYSQITELEADVKKESIDSLDGWKKGGYFALNGSQVSLTNWVAGGQNSISINSLFGLYANLKKGKMTWENSLDFGYGILRQSEKLFSPTGEKWIKTDDRLDMNSKYGKRASQNWYYAGLINFRTQTTAGYDYAIDDVTEISGFMAPGYLLGAIGMDYKPNKKFSMFVAPLTSKLTFVNDTILANNGAFGVTPAALDPLTGIYTPGRQFRAEFGGYIRMQYKTKLAPNVNYSTRLDLFSNYLNNPSRLDVNWENLVEIKLWKFISATLSTTLIYDDDIKISSTDESGIVSRGPRVQFKEVFGLGLSWKFDQD